jgi:hypothetical protein
LVEKATFSRGKLPPDSLKAKHGWSFLYCKEIGHWYADCKLYWQDFCHGFVDATPPNHAKQDSKFVPPARPAQPPVNANGRFRKIDIPEENEGKVLLVSGSTINVSGNSTFFTLKAKLKSPLLILLAISKYVASINSIGSLRIPTPTGIMEVEDVYYCKGITGSIVSTGSLLRNGWHLRHEGTEAWLTNRGGSSFYLDFNNFCWTVQLQSAM